MENVRQNEASALHYTVECVAGSEVEMERSNDEQALIEQMRSDLRGLDDEAIADWWLSRAKNMGWPACVSRWLHDGLQVEHLRALDFCKMEVRLARGNFTEGDWGPIAPRIDYLKTRNAAVVTDEVKRSLEYHLSHLKKHKVFIHPVILEENPPGIFRVLDANHLTRPL